MLYLMSQYLYYWLVILISGIMFINGQLDGNELYFVANDLMQIELWYPKLKNALGVGKNGVKIIMEFGENDPRTRDERDLDVLEL